MTAPTAGFMVIYRWRLHPGREQQFIDCWSRNTPIIAERCGGLGSRLHRAEDGSWLAYAQWPDRATWERSYSVPDWRTEAEHRQWAEAVAETFPRILLEPVADLLVTSNASSSSAAGTGR